MLFLIRKRFFEIFCLSLFSSAPFMVLLAAHLIPALPIIRSALMGVSFLIFGLLNIHLLHEFYMGVREKKAYFLINLSAYTLYVVLSLIIYYVIRYLLPEDFVMTEGDALNLFSGVFMPTRIFQVLNILRGTQVGSGGYFSIMASMLIVHALSYAIIILVYIVNSIRHLPDQFADEEFTDEQLMNMFGYERTPEEKEEYKRRLKALEEEDD